jgi:hypothetical protein
MHRLKAALLCALLTIGAIAGTTPTCGRSATHPVCCKNEATCPMHQKHASFGFDVCRGDADASSTVTASPRAVLARTVSITAAPQRDHVFAPATILLPSVSILPATPPPRIA